MRQCAEASAHCPILGNSKLWFEDRKNFSLRQHLRDIGSVSFLLHPGERYKTQGGAVDAVSESAGFCGAVLEHMSQVGITVMAAHLNTPHAVAVIFLLCYGLRLHRLREAGPAAAGIEFVGGSKERFPCDDIHI